MSALATVLNGNTQNKQRLMSCSIYRKLGAGRLERIFQKSVPNSSYNPEKANRR